MAIPEACGLWIEQRVQEELEANPDNPNLSKIGRDVAQEIERLFETRVNPEMIRSRARRSAARSNDRIEQPAETTTEKPKSNEIKREPAKDGTMRGGPREGAGRKPKAVEQDAVWKNVAKKINSVCEYIYSHGELPPSGVSDDTIGEIHDAWRALIILLGEFDDGTKQQRLPGYLQ